MSMAENHEHSEPTAVDDVRRAHEIIAKQHHGDIRQHMEETNRIFREMQERLNLKVVEPAAKQRD